MSYTFKASRITNGNTLFPTTIVIDNHHLYCYKGNLIGGTRIAIPKSDIASIRLDKGLIFTDLIVETRGGHLFFLKGVTHSDGKKIYSILNGNRRYR